jgi:hypothetical protein
MKDQRRFAPKGVRITPESVSGFTGICTESSNSNFGEICGTLGVNTLTRRDWSNEKGNESV